MAILHPGQFGRYRVVRTIGAGAMGQVFEGFDPEIERRVAIKTIRLAALSDEVAAEFHSRFRAEMRAAGRLQHPNIVALYDAGQDEGLAYIVMEFVDGEDLKQRLDRGETFTPAQAIELLRQLLAALANAHAQGIVHRDVKPANILLTREGLLKLADFGVARLQESGDATRTRGGVIGTVRYASPEQLGGQPVDGRSDLFSSGVVLYRLLTGRPPFDGPNELAVMQAVLQEQPLPPSQVNDALPRALDAVVLKALAKQPGDRHADAAAFAAALAPFAQVAGGTTAPFGAPAGTWPGGATAPAAMAGGRPARIRKLALGIALLVAAGGSAWYLARPTTPKPVVRASGFDGAWSGLFVCSERLDARTASAPGGNPFSEKLDVRIDRGRITWARKRGSVNETMVGAIAAGGAWDARGQGVDAGTGGAWVTAGSGRYNTTVDPPRLDGEFTIASEDGKHLYRRCTLGAVRAAERKASGG